MTCTVERPKPLHVVAREAWEAHKFDALIAFRIFKSYCEQPLPRVPGMDTVIRLAIRVAGGRTVEEAAAKEYTYRWHLALDSEINRLESRSRSKGNVWGFPHAFGM